MSRSLIILSLALLIALSSFAIFPPAANAAEMRNKVGYLSFFPASRGFHFDLRFTNIRIGRNSIEVGWYEDGGIGVAKVFRTNSATYFTFGPVFGSFDTIGLQAGAGLEYDLLSFLQVRGELFATGTAKTEVDGTGLLGITAHF